MDPVLRRHSDYWIPFIYAHGFVCMCASVCVCVIFPECYSENKKRGTKKEEPSNDRATLIRLSKAIIAEFQHYSV